jgi:hypothetical protein
LPHSLQTAAYPVRVPRVRGLASQRALHKVLLRLCALLLPAALLALAGCAGGPVRADLSDVSFSLTPGTVTIDTNCAGCNATGPKGSSVEQFSVRPATGGAVEVDWSVTGGDAKSGPGSITDSGQYAPPSYLTADRVQVVVTASLNGNAIATTVLTITPGFLQPLTPENAALAANGQITVTGWLAEAGGEDAIAFVLANSDTGSSGGQGFLSPATCQRNPGTFTSCSVTYTAPSPLPATGVTYVVATVGTTASRTAADLLLNTAGVSSNAAAHQAQLASPKQLGSSGGNNNDYDLQRSQIADCCGGTLGSLIQDANDRQYLLSNNHVLARSDHATVGDTIVQPGLIDNNCTPYGEGAGTSPVGTLTAWLPLNAASTNADAAIAQVASGTVDPGGNILELGTRQSDGSLGAAPPGISSTAGNGERASLGLAVAKSGRTTGLTCAFVSALGLDVDVDYFTDCAETKPYLTKTYTDQLAVTGNQFSDAGDSGSLIVDAANAEPVGLFFAGGTDAAGVSEGIASPAPDVLNELASLSGSAASYSFVGGVDHSVSCLSYGDSTISQAQARTLSDAEMMRTQLALNEARLLVNPTTTGILGVATGKSSDRPGEGAVLVYTDEGLTPAIPATILGVRTTVIPTSAHAVLVGSAPLTPFDIVSVSAHAIPASGIAEAMAIKRKVAHDLMLATPAFFGIGVGQSLDDPKEAALIIYVDRKSVPAQLPAVINGLRVRYILMDRLHVTRNYASAIESRSHCVAPSGSAPDEFEPDLVHHDIIH